MKPLFSRLILAAALLGIAPHSFAQKPAATLAAPAINEVKSIQLDWLDAKRNRRVPAKLLFPAAGDGPFPLIIISHGLGSNRDGLDYVGQFWAAHGYVCAQIQHIDSDDSLWRGNAQPLKAMADAASSETAINNRPLDAKFAIDQMIALNADPKSELFGRIDTAEIGIAGHSFGAFTSQAVAGRASDQKPQWHDSRVKACVAMSAPSGPTAQIRAQFAAFKTPFYFLTGTQDNIPFVTPETTPESRRAAFDSITGVDGYYLLINDADHMSFSGGRMFGNAAGDALDHELVRTSTLEFFDAYLKGSANAKKDLRDGGFAKVLGDHGTLEVK